MEPEEKKLIYREIDTVVNTIYNQLKLTCEEKEKGMFVTKEIHLFKGSDRVFEYTIELVIKANINTDDYGVVFSLNIEELEKEVIIITDIIRSFGEVLYQKKYILKSIQLTDILEDAVLISNKLFGYVNAH